MWRQDMLYFLANFLEMSALLNISRYNCIFRRIRTQFFVVFTFELKID